MLYTRRELGKLALAAVPGATLLPRLEWQAAQKDPARPDSNVAGVQIGLNVPYSFNNNLMSADDTLEGCVKLGISAVELRSQPVELYAGAPQAAFERGATADAKEALRKWRLSAPMDKVRECRKKYDDAGVKIEIVKFDNIYKEPDDVTDYFFELGRTLGARALSCEISLEETKRLGQFADKHQMMVGYHGHTETTPEMWETAFGYATHNGANVDIGHFIAGNNTSPVPFIRQHHDRITHLHIKDKKLKNGPNVPFGEGDTPIKEVLQLLRDNKWPIQATIEFEYPVPPGSSRMVEIAKCVQYCRAALSS
ncbi:MAG: sugar phosphate isomerase/epimerase [Acidobacteria bacterium]|nr:MAG: sugar phosphate isomerase/epimerase [Acidobacteriota bacterium]